MDSYFSKIVDACGLKDDQIFHTAHHTFATSVSLNNVVPIKNPYRKY